ncbi:REP element-mobilizing transposase RayT [Dyadobacter jejuensis]|uniref:REP element-mobilizing transposase RayT n=1 Tax=Dyadobacter jejuensis TaxID=1082580 RepID=A0A316A5Z4_9BACT|nr:IS200/IS605 family transposase [Dyadobacter jejuensis]PWJ53105.1 REP element-mobilizing transposase RayT [Dyadobacter jejuensis]
MNTYSQIYVHIVFAVKGRENLILPSWEEKIYKYITGIVQNKEQKMIAINGMPDHIHFLLGIRPTCCISDMVREIKKSSNLYIQTEQLSKFKFQWQEGFGAFSYSHSHLDMAINYILRQKEHHKKKSFGDEYIEMLQKFNIDYNDKYLLE